MQDFDFIIVGGGASGSLLAARLAYALPKQNVLVLDAGGENTARDHQAFGERHFTRAVPGYSWGYKTVPQKHLKDREIDYNRGKGLGGSTAVNFCVYTRGPSADYDHWAEVVKDDTWSWTNVQKRYNKFERFHHPSKEYETLVEAADPSHGFQGEVDVGMTAMWDPTFGDFLERIFHYCPKNLDHNSGNPLGIAVCQQSTYDERRTTASEAFLSNRPPNLTVLTNSPVTKIIFRDRKAVGIETNGQSIHARCEVILSAGTIESPKLLLLSGVGPADDLKKLDIPVITNLPVGQNLNDRLFLELVTIQKPESHHRTFHFSSPEEFEEARRQWMNDKDGPLAGFYLPQMIGYIQSEKILASEEFQQLNLSSKKALQAKTKPTYEIMSQSPSLSAKAPELYLASAVAFPGTEDSGRVSLRSTDPKDHPLIDPNFLSSPFDRRLAIEAVRETVELLNTPLVAEGRIRWAAGPSGMGDEEILDFVRSTAKSMWHACGTVKMGSPEEPTTCVSTDFKVMGLERLRVVDMSVAPFLPSRRREEEQTPTSYQILEDAHQVGEAPPEAEETAEEGSGKPPRPKDKSNYGSASRRAGRNIKRVKELPPVHIPPWFLSRNVILHDSERQIAYSQLSEELWTYSSRSHGPNIPEEPPKIEGQESTASDPNDQSHVQSSHESSSNRTDESQVEPYKLDLSNWREIFSIAKAGLQLPSWQRADIIASQNPHPLIFCPRDGASGFLEWIGRSIARDNGTDLLRLNPQDIAEVCGDYLDEPSTFRPNTLSSLGYDAPFVSASRHAPPSEEPAEEEDYDEVEGEEGPDNGPFKSGPFQRISGGAIGGGAIHYSAFAGSIPDVLKSLIPMGSSTQTANPIIVGPTQQQPKDMTPELKMGLLVETLLNTPEIKRVASAAAKDAGNDTGAQVPSEDQAIDSRLSQEKASERESSDRERGDRGLVMLISDYPQISSTLNGSKFLDKLHEAVEDRRQEGQRILIVGTSSSQDLMPSLSKSAVKEIQDSPRPGPTRSIITTVKEPFTGALDRDHKEKIKKINIRHLRDMLRRIAPNFTQVVQVVVDWDLDIDSKVGFLSSIDESVWSMDRVNRVVTTALGLLEQSENLTNRHIERALELIETSDTAKVDWVREEKERRKRVKTESPDSDDRDNSKERIRKLRKTCNEHEKKLLNGVVHPENIRTTFSDVQAPETTLDALKTLTSLSLVRPDAFTYGVLATDRIPGLLLYGPPGTGKTLLAKAVAKESGATVLEVSGSDVYDMYVGEGEKNVRAIFSLAKKLTPCIIFIDEADAILGSRGGSGGGGSNRTSHRELINQFLREWDGMTETSAFIMVATNRPFDLDEASLRRLPRRLLVDLPVEKDRENILKIHLKDELLDPAVSLSHLASQTPFYSGSDLKNVAVAAALACVREEFDTAAAATAASLTHDNKDPSSSSQQQQRQPLYPAKRTLRPHHFTKAMEEISASISEDMGSLSAIRKFDEKYGDRRGRRKKGGYGFKTVRESERVGSDGARVRNQS